MYSKYQEFLTQVNFCDLSKSDFKSNREYNEILEHASYEQGKEYMNLITKFIEEDFKDFITFDEVRSFLLLNDKYGGPKKHTFLYKNIEVMCSPTSLRYVQHSFLILQHLRKTNLNKIVEVGCGYGGLFLAINHFSKILNIEIEKYFFIDLPEVCNLIKKYNELHSENINIMYSIHSANNYGSDINEKDMFFISNYCFTEIDSIHRNNYAEKLFPKISGGFIIWQTLFGVPVNMVNNIIGKVVKNCVEENPQTATIENKNYIVYF